MERLADYFAVAGLKATRTADGDDGELSAAILQRFPVSEWDDVAFPQGIEMFCQPSGWKTSKTCHPPTFFTSVLTDVEGQRAICTCLSFWERISKSNTELEDSDKAELAFEYRPKSFFLIARHPFVNLLKGCLCLVYKQFVQSSVSNPPESLISKILSYELMPAAGVNVITYSLGCGECLELRLSDSRNYLPYTETAVAQLFRTLGLQNTIQLVCTVIAENRILFHSESYSVLNLASQALVALLFPLAMNYPFIPILPASLVDFLSAPTPFIMGVNTSYLPSKQNLTDLVVVDLDGGVVSIPDGVVVPQLPGFLVKPFYRILLMIFKPGLLTADLAFSSLHQHLNMSERKQDKAARALFLHLFATLFHGYRSFLTVGRIHPEPFIEFCKEQFKNFKSIENDEFTAKLISGLAFSSFIVERGLPFRACDIFDDLVAQGNFFDFRRNEQEMMDDIMQLAAQLEAQEPIEIMKLPEDMPSLLSSGFEFRDFDGSLIEKMMEREQSPARAAVKFNKVEFRTVSESTAVPQFSDLPTSPDVPSRDISQLKNCIAALLNNKMTEATKYLPGVCRSMKSASIRKLFVEILSERLCSHYSLDGAQGHKMILSNTQFDVMVQLMNAALRSDSGAGCFNTAAALLPLTTVYCRELSPSVSQFVYTCVQDHVVWENTHFWKQAFYDAVQHELYKLYVNSHDEDKACGNEPPQQRKRTSSIVDTASEGLDRNRNSVSNATVIKLLAKRMCLWSSLSDEKQAEWSAYEEATVYGQCVNFASRMVWLLTPFSSMSETDVMQFCDDNDTLALAGQRENTSPWETDDVVKFVLRVFNPICLETQLSSERVSSLSELVTGILDLHLDYLQQVQDECRRIQPLPKVKSMRPAMLEGESVVTDGMRAYLLSDGREVGLGVCGMNGPRFLPADGAIYLTTYRVVFQGLPCDSNAGDASIVRSLPVSAVVQIKKLAPVYLNYNSRWLQDVFQIRSATFELMKIGFDDEDVSTSSVELFSRFLKGLRSPASVNVTFAFAASSETEWKRVGVAGDDGKDQLEVKDASTFVKKLARRGAVNKDREFVKESMVGTLRHACAMSPVRPPRESDTMRMKKRRIRVLRTMLYSNDFERVGLGKLTEGDKERVDDLWRVTCVNIDYHMCRSYPAVLCVPVEVTDSQLLRVSSQYNQSRLPVATWRHPRTGTVLLRSSSSAPTNMVAKLKGGLAQLGTSPQLARKLTPSSLTSVGLQSQEVKSYLAAVVAATPRLRRNASQLLFEDGLDISDLFSGLQAQQKGNGQDLQNKRHSTFFVDLGEDSLDQSVGTSCRLSEIKKAALEKALTGSLDSRLMKKSGASTEMSRVTVIANKMTVAQLDRTEATDETSHDTQQQVHSPSNPLETFQQKVMTLGRSKRVYVIGERQNLKNVKEENFPACEFIPVDIPGVGVLRQNHKKLMRACAPSDSHSDPNTFYSTVNDSGWLDNVRTVIQLAGAVVDLLDVQRASVLVSFEEGSDATAQVVSLAQLLLDPYYRTRFGFQVLIEKEWLAFGHRFSQRNNQTTASSVNDFSPVFLLFLDAVHQVMLQFPLAFEFNLHYIETLAYHQSSMRFATFLLNSEKERCEEGWLPHSRQRMDIRGGRTAPKLKTGKCFWSHVDKLDSESPLFYNMKYKADKDNPVLRPYGNISNLQVWSYFTRADIHSPIASYETTAKNTRGKMNIRPPYSPVSPRPHQGSFLSTKSSVSKSIALCKSSALGGIYGDSSLVLLDEFSMLFKRCVRLASALQQSWPLWREVWNDLKIPVEEILIPTQQSPRRLVTHGLTAHKRTSIEVLLKGKLGGNAENKFSHPHRFNVHTYVTPTYCNYCRQILWGVVHQGFRCADCGYNCHEKCRPLVPKDCHEFVSFDIPEGDAVATNAADDFSDMDPEARARLGSQSVFYSNKKGYSSHQHEGFLYKKADLRKKWKYWWCVLDIELGELKYYEALRESQCRGTIPVAECSEVLELESVTAGAPQVDGGDGYCFELVHPKRNYLFMAKTAVLRDVWLQKLSLCLNTI